MPATSPALVDELLARMLALRDSAYAEATTNAYEGDLRRFESFCKALGVSWFPATPRTVALYVADLDLRGRKPSTISRALAAISQLHQAAELHSPSRIGEAKQSLRGVKRTRGTRPSKKMPLLVADLRAISASLDDSAAAVRDRALLVVGFAAALRRSELVALDVQDITFDNNGMRVFIKRSKRDQEGAGQEVGVPYGSHALTCPVRAMRAWLERSQITEGAVFRACTRRGKVGKALAPGDVGRILKRRAAAAELESSALGAHSLRRGFITAAARAGVAERDIMRQSRHQSAESLREYIEAAGLFENNAAARVGL